MAIIESAKTKSIKTNDPTGNNGIENLKSPYPPIFKRTPANITDPAVGAST